MAAPLSEEQFKAAILHRLAMKDTPIETALKRFVQLEKCFGSEDEASSKEKIADILKELDQYQFQVEKEQLIYESYQRDCKHYELLFQQKEQEIATVKAEIEELKIRLKNEQQGKRNKEEYMALAKLINKHPPRAETERAIAAVKEDLAVVEARSKEISVELEARSKQFQLLLFSIGLLQTDLDAEIPPALQKKRKRQQSQQATGEPLPSGSAPPAKRAKIDSGGTSEAPSVSGGSGTDPMAVDTTSKPEQPKSK